MYPYSLYAPPRARPALTQYTTRTCTSTVASLPQADKECTDVKKFPFAGASTPFETNAYAFGKYSGGNVTLKE